MALSDCVQHETKSPGTLPGVLACRIARSKMGLLTALLELVSDTQLTLCRGA